MRAAITVSVVIPCYNQGHLLDEAIESALLQSRRAEEIVVVDDGSTDQTARVCARYEGAITYVRQQNAGLSAARNTGIRASSSDYIQFLDADDMLRPATLEHMAAAAEQNPGGAVVRGSWEEIDDHGSMTASVVAADLGPDPYHALFDPIAVGPPCRYMARRRALLDAGLFDTSLRSCEDWDMWLRLAFAGSQFLTSPEAMSVYRRHAASMSRDHRRMWDAGSAVLREARGRHGCTRCESAYREGIERWREYCYLSILRADIRGAIRDRRLRDGLTLSSRAVTHDPPIAKLVAASVARRLRRRIER